MKCGAAPPRIIWRVTACLHPGRWGPNNRTQTAANVGFSRLPGKLRESFIQANKENNARQIRWLKKDRWWWDDVLPKLCLISKLLWIAFLSSGSWIWALFHCWAHKRKVGCLKLGCTSQIEVRKFALIKNKISLGNNAATAKSDWQWEEQIEDLSRDGTCQTHLLGNYGLL